jgi:hypothetical protein
VSTAAQARPAPDIRVVSASATPEEVAAVTVVLTAALDELAEAMAVDPAATVSGWRRSQRSTRTPLGPGAGAWRTFEG